TSILVPKRSTVSATCSDESTPEISMRSGPRPRGRRSMPQRRMSSGIESSRRAALRADCKRNHGLDRRNPSACLITAANVPGASATRQPASGSMAALRLLRRWLSEIDRARVARACGAAAGWQRGRLGTGYEKVEIKQLEPLHALVRAALVEIG